MSNEELIAAEILQNFSQENAYIEVDGESRKVCEFFKRSDKRVLKRTASGTCCVSDDKLGEKKKKARKA
jgi:hypothetical protein